MVVVVDVDGGEDAMDIAVVLVKREGGVERANHGLDSELAIGTPVIDPRLPDDTRLPGMSMGILGIELDRPIDKPLRLQIVFLTRPMMENLRGEDAFIGAHIAGRAALNPLMRRRLDSPRQGRNDGCRHLV